MFNMDSEEVYIKSLGFNQIKGLFEKRGTFLLYGRYFRNY